MATDQVGAPAGLQASVAWFETCCAAGLAPRDPHPPGSAGSPVACHTLVIRHAPPGMGTKVCSCGAACCAPTTCTFTIRHAFVYTQNKSALDIEREQEALLAKKYGGMLKRKQPLMPKVRLTA